MLAGPLALWWAMFRRNAQWLHHYSPVTRQMTIEPMDALYEFVTSGLYGSSVGAVVGVWGALIVGPMWAYLAFARHRSRAIRELDADQARDAEVMAPAAGFAPIMRRLILLAFLIGLLGFPSYTAWRLWRQSCDKAMLSRLNEAGLKAQAVFVDQGPMFLHRDYQFVHQSVKRCFLSFLELDVKGELGDDALLALSEVPNSIKIHFHNLEASPNDEQLRQIFATIERLDVLLQARTRTAGWARLNYAQLHGARASILLRGEKFTSAGLKDMLDRYSYSRIEFIYEDEAARVLQGLWQEPNFAANAQRRMIPTEHHLIFTTSYHGNDISYALPRQPPPMVPLFFRWPF